MKITLITVGKIKEKYLKDAITEYSKRLSRYCKLEIIEVADEKTPDNASETVEDGIRDKEGERILKYVRDDAYVVTLEIEGKLLTSEELAKKIENLGMESPDPAENYVQLPEETTQWDGTFTKEDYQKLVQRMYNGEYEVSSDSTTFPETEITATDYGSIK